MARLQGRVILSSLPEVSEQLVMKFFEGSDTEYFAVDILTSKPVSYDATRRDEYEHLTLMFYRHQIEQAAEQFENIAKELRARIEVPL